jgi:hypothetical protein
VTFDGAERLVERLCNVGCRGRADEFGDGGKLRAIGHLGAEDFFGCGLKTANVIRYMINHRRRSRCVWRRFV